MSKRDQAQGFSTRAIHAGQEPDPRTGAVVVPIVNASTFKQDRVGEFREGYEYSRTDNPTRRALEDQLAALELGTHARAFASGSAATAAVCDLLEPGDEVLTTIDVYGGTYRFFSQVMAKFGITFRFLDTADPEAILSVVTPSTRMIWVETPTNPMLNVIDLTALAAGKPKDVLLVADNTFASPYCQNPLELGADLVVHSATKYLGGHSDVVGGAVVTRRAELDERLAFYQNAAGGVPSPFDCFLVSRGIKTLAVRMERHGKNAEAIAAWLFEQPKVKRVIFPGLPDHPQHALAARQMRAFPGMVSFVVEGGRAAAEKLLERLEVFALAESLGGVESLACLPWAMTHAAIPPLEKEKIGIGEDLVRLSCGIEDLADLRADLERALDAI